MRRLVAKISSTVNPSTVPPAKSFPRPELHSLHLDDGIHLDSEVWMVKLSPRSWFVKYR